MDRYEHLETVFQERQRDEVMVATKINSGEDPEMYLPFLEGTFTVFAVYWMYFKEDSMEARSFFFKAARTAEHMSARFERPVIERGIYPMSYALLSDSRELIQRYSVLRNKKNNELTIGFQIPNAMQHILMGRMEDLSESIRKLERFVQVPRFKWYSSLVEVFKGFLLEDASKIEAGLQLMLKDHKKRNTDPLISRFLSVDTAGLCKLAWIKGYEIDLKNELVPLELMPIRPLDHYRDSYLIGDANADG